MTRPVSAIIRLAASALIVACTAFACRASESPVISRDASPGECRIAIDVGHTRRVTGATSARGVGEFFFNQAMARKLRDELRALGLKGAFIINEEGDDLLLVARTEEAAARGADLFLSIHHDSVQPRYLSNWEFDGTVQRYSDRFRGFSLFYSDTGARPRESLELARRIGTHLRTAGLEPTLHHAEQIEGENRTLVDSERGIYIYGELAVLRTATMPAVLLECGVIVNRKEEALLDDPVYRSKLAAAVATAIAETCTEAGTGS
jgi:N-acetylmuramoyl-L-alanine amidase